ncbi:MAG TPA: DUF5103 domain-containing protein [Chitinophagaceae bacterium]|jgi:hypothetical protein|nr:DUF5103 domain-containing protein [Chitinophagaceae bacterium]
MRKCITIIALLFVLKVQAQTVFTDGIVMPNIKTVQLYQQNNQMSLPVINLLSSDLLELHFDDLDGYVKNYFYTFQLCNENWEEVNLSPFDYIKGFTQNRVSQYRVASIALTKYVHYQAVLPERGSIPTKSGNYLLKVFLNGDVNQLAFTKKMYVVESKANIAAQVLQPFDNSKFRTHQRVQISVNATQLNPINPQQQVKLVVMQNNRYDNVVRNIMPAFIRGNILEYNGEQDCLFPAGKEYRWVDLRSFRYESERIDKIDKTKQPNEVFVKPDAARSQLRYTYFRDMNGWYTINSTENINPFWQGDYANVHFGFLPNNAQEFVGKDVYLIGAFTNGMNETNKLEYNDADGVFETTMFLKQGYYSYTYLSKDSKDKKAKPDVGLTDGNFWETENDYTVFVYFRSLSGRHDELVGITTINSRMGRGGF